MLADGVAAIIVLNSYHYLYLEIIIILLSRPSVALHSFAVSKQQAHLSSASTLEVQSSCHEDAYFDWDKPHLSYTSPPFRSHISATPVNMSASTTTSPRESSSALMPPPSAPLPSSTMPTPLDEARLTDDDIDSLIASLSPTSELDHLRSIEKTIRETQMRRRKETEEHTAKIHALQSALSDLRKQSTRQAAEWRSLASHAETIEKLDNRNFDLAKKINEQESVLSNMQNEVMELKRTCDELEEVDIEDETEMDRDA